jgi:hypothetical protein
MLGSMAVKNYIFGKIEHSHREGVVLFPEVAPAALWIVAVSI